MDGIDTQIVRLLRQQLPDVIAIYRFGSSITQSSRPDSDVDTAVLPSYPLDSSRVWKVAQTLAQLVGTNVDLVDLLRATTVMRAQVISTGRRLYCSVGSECERFEDFVYADYARLNEERKGILQDIEQRGTVYG